MHTPEDRQVLRRLAERGNSLVEYVLLMALIALVCIAALSFFGKNSKNSVGHSTDCIVLAGSSTPCT